MRIRIARPYLVENTVSELPLTSVSGVPFALVRLSWMKVDPCGAEETGKRTVTVCPGGMMTTSWNRPMVSCDVRATVATSLIRMDWTSSPFSIDTGTSPDEPPIRTWLDFDR